MKHSSLHQNIKETYSWLRERGLVKDDLVVDQLPSPEAKIGKKKLVYFCSNNYLGLSKHPLVLSAAHKAATKYGIGTCESRKLGGNLNLLEQLEKEIASFKGTEKSVIFATGLMTNVGVISALTDVDHYCQHFFNKSTSSKETVILSDKLNHRSIQMGIKLSKAQCLVYEHSNINHLSELLKQNEGKHVLVVTDGVFSMDGDFACLSEIVKIAKKYRAMIMVDDAHGTGVIGEQGRGIAEHFQVEDDIEIKMGTLSKAFGGLGGFVAADKHIVDMLKVNTSTYYFTSSLPAEQAAGLIQSVKIAKNNHLLRYCLWNNAYQVIKGLLEIGLTVPKRWSHIVPIIIGDEKKCYKAEDMLLKKGIVCCSATAPAVAPGKARLRLTINATHTQSHIAQLLNSLKEISLKLDLPNTKPIPSDWSLLKHNTPAYVMERLNCL